MRRLLPGAYGIAVWVICLVLSMTLVEGFTSQMKVIDPNGLHLHSKTPLLLKLSASKGSSSPDVSTSQKREALEGVMQQIEKSYGKGSLVKMGESTALDIDKTSSGSYTLDVALGGGYPKGRVIEIFGPESSGKTTLALHAIAEIQKTGGTAAFIDVEHALDPEYASNLGVDVPSLYVCQPDCGEMALDVVDQLVRSAAVDIVVVDSVAALVPRAELEGDMGDMQVGLQARLMSKALRKLTGSLSKSQTTVIFLNQLRTKVGVMYGNPEVTSGGNALKFYSSIRLDIRRKEVLANNEGILVKVKIVKNKVYPPFRLVEFDILFGSGINKMGCLIDAGEAVGLVERKGSWYNYGSVRLGQGRKAAIDFIANDAKIQAEIEVGIKASIKEKPTLKIPVNLDPDDIDSLDENELPEII